ncbi:unnamed protein product [Amoebophrya sp. A120]|nr:unnamed protein product [Amoebophrya sp. A120]|eukprot:GSA120T00006731001.1
MASVFLVSQRRSFASRSTTSARTVVQLGSQLLRQSLATCTWNQGRGTQMLSSVAVRRSACAAPVVASTMVYSASSSVSSARPLVHLRGVLARPCVFLDNESAAARSFFTTTTSFVQPQCHSTHGLATRNHSTPRRTMSSTSSSTPSSGPEYEKHVRDLIARHFTAKLSPPTETVNVQVTDRSGGCGTSYEIVVESRAFDSKSRLQRERMVQEPIREEIKKWHAVTIRTLIPQEDESSST